MQEFGWWSWCYGQVRTVTASKNMSEVIATFCKYLQFKMVRELFRRRVNQMVDDRLVALII
jgi:hypothetical protein